MELAYDLPEMLRRRAGWLIRQPLIHFILIGAAIFGVWMLRAGSAVAPPGEIRVGTSELQWLRDTWIAQFGHAPDATEMQSAIRGYVDEEMRYREGLALGLDREDSIVRRRLAQKYDFLMGTEAASLNATEAQLRAEYDRHPQRYVAPAQTSFCQVYFGAGDVGFAAAKSALAALPAAARTNPGTVRTKGEPLPYPRCYPNAAPQDVLRDFGQAFSISVGRLPEGVWQGPVESGYGFHLVIATARTAPSRLSFEAARTVINSDWRIAAAAAARDRTERELRQRYRIRIDQRALARITGPRS